MVMVETGGPGRAEAGEREGQLALARAELYTEDQERGENLQSKKLW